MGNIYLLVTTNPEGEVVWHLDAIQIPALIDWDKAVEQMLEGLGEQAKKKGVKYITVNQESSLISNYNYIGDAFMAYTKNSNSPKIRISLPQVNTEIYSEFQGNGDAYVVWENK